MSKFIKRLTDIILKRKKSRLYSVYKKLKGKSKNRGRRLFTDDETTIELSGGLDKELEKRDFCTKNIVKKYLNNPDGMLEYIKEHGTAVYKLDYADVILDFIKEEEGFILPKKGFKALYLNLVLLFSGKKITGSLFSTEGMFVLRNISVNIYTMLHQFHKWMSFKMNLPGCDDETQELLRDMMYNRTDSGMMSVDEILSLKEAIARDREAIDFVLGLARETEGAKNALNRLKDEGSASI